MPKRKADIDSDNCFCRKCYKIQKLLDYSKDFSENLKKTEMFLEVGSFDEMCLILDKITEWHWVPSNPNPTEIKHISPGVKNTIGYYGELPIQISFDFVMINGHMVTFHHPISQLVYYPMIEEWLTRFFPKIPQENSYFEMFKFYREI